MGAVLDGFGAVRCEGRDSAEAVWAYTESIVSHTDGVRDLFAFLMRHDRDALSATLADAVHGFIVRASREYAGGGVSEEYLYHSRYIASGLASFLMLWMEHPETGADRAREMLYPIHAACLDVAAYTLGDSA